MAPFIVIFSLTAFYASPVWAEMPLKEGYQIGEFKFQSTCKKAPPGSENPFIDCQHIITKGSKSFEIKGGERMKVVRLPFQPKTEILLASTTAACCTEPQVLEFFDSDGKALGKAGIAPALRIPNSVFSLDQTFVNKEFAIIFPGHPDIMSSEPSLRQLYFSASENKTKVRPVTGISLPQVEDCDWYLSRVLDDSKIEFKTYLCDKDQKLQFSCRAGKTSFDCTKI